MSSLLRSTKLVRYFCGAARTLILNSAKNVETSILLNTTNLTASSSIVVRNYATSKNRDTLEPLLQFMDSEIRRSGRITKRNIDELFDGLKTSRDISSSQSLLVIRCCGEILCEELPEKRTELVQKIWSVLSDIGVPMDISHYNTLLRVYIENEHPFSPAEFLEELANKGLQPNHVTYQRLMWRYCQQGDIDGATKVLENMRELGLPITIPVLNALVLGHSNIGDIEGAKAVLDTVGNAGLQATSHTYSLLACGYAKKGDVQGVKDVVNKANSGEHFMTNKDIYSIIEAFAVNGHADKLDFLFDYLEQGPTSRQDAYNATLHLINKSQEAVARKIFKTLLKPKYEGEDQFYQGAFFIKQILKVQKSPSEILNICKELREEGLVPNALFIALEAALYQGNSELAQNLLKEVRGLGMELREHYFWPLLVMKGKENDEEGLIQILRSMSTEGITPSKETLQNYVIPYLLKNTDPTNVVVKLQISNIPTYIAVKSVIVELLQGSRIQEATNLAQQFSIQGSEFMKEALLSALIRTKDISAFTKLLQVTNARNENAQNVGSQESEQDSGSKDNDLDDIIIKAVKKLKTPDNYENLLKHLLSRGLGITSQGAEAIAEFIGQDMTPELSDILTKLTSEDLEIAPVTRTNQQRVRSSAELEAAIANLKQKGSDVSGFKKMLLVAYIKDNDVEKVNAFMKELEQDQNFNIISTTLSQLIEFYCDNNDIEKALHYKEMLSQKYPEYNLFNLRHMQLAHALIKANRVDEAIELFKNITSDENYHFQYKTKCWNVLNELAEQKNVEKLKEFFNLLVEKKFIQPTNVLLGPLIKVHILQNDIDGALKEFELCAKKYRCTPWKGEIMKLLIEAEDATRLQWVADLSTEIHGEINILYDLILAFVECGRLRQARKILQTPGLHTRNQRLHDAAKRYANEGQTECIEGLLEATKELSHIDRSKIYYHLLTSYCKNDETDRAMELWTHLQEEGQVPTDQFLITLGKHLTEKNRPIPFIIPTPIKKKEIDPVSNSTLKVDYSKNIISLLEEENTEEATKLALKSLKENILPSRKASAFLMKTLSEKGDFKSLNLLEPYYEKHKNMLNLDYKIKLAKVNSGEGANILDELEKALETESPEMVSRQFPAADALNALLQNEDFSRRCIDIASKLAAKDQILPANLIWMEYLIKGNHEQAKVIWDLHLFKASHIKYKRLIQYAINNKKPEFIETIIENLKENKNITPQALGNAYSRLIYFYAVNKNPEKAKKYLDTALNSGLTEKEISLNTWSVFKRSCLEKGIEFNYNSPTNNKI